MIDEILLRYLEFGIDKDYITRDEYRKLLKKLFSVDLKSNK